jgi:hypothetical protein
MLKINIIIKIRNVTFYQFLSNLNGTRIVNGHISKLYVDTTMMFLMLLVVALVVLYKYN